MQNQSRRRIAKYVARELARGQNPALIAESLAAYLVTSKQTRSADLLLRDIEAAVLRDESHLVAEVFSAHKLTAEMRDELSRALMRETKAKTIEMSETIDENLIGGVVVHTPSAEMDASLKTKLARLRAI